MLHMHNETTRKGIERKVERIKMAEIFTILMKNINIHTQETQSISIRIILRD